jgi:hypothetical protein
LIGANSFADESLQDRILRHEKDFEQIKIEHLIMYRMVSELYIEKKGYSAYEDLVLSAGEKETKDLK